MKIGELALAAQTQVETIRLYGATLDAVGIDARG
jgi:hypothetical protein